MPISPTVTRCQGILKRFGPPTDAARSFSDFPEDIQSLVLSQADLQPGEETAIAYYANPTLWTLLTSTRLIWSLNGATSSAAWSKIADADPKDDELIIHNPFAKFLRDRLVITTTEGICTELRLEPATFQAFWKAINCMLQIHHSHPDRPSFQNGE